MKSTINYHSLLQTENSMETSLKEQREAVSVMLNIIGDAVISMDPAGKVTFMNAVAEKMTGWPLRLASGRQVSEVFRILDARTRLAAVNPAQSAITRDCVVDVTDSVILFSRDGMEITIENTAAPVHNTEGQVIGAVIAFHDVKYSRTAAEKMAYLAEHDVLTGLPNRIKLMDRLSLAIGLANRHRKMVALLFIDVDNFKSVNDSQGHDRGDSLLVTLARKLEDSVRETDTVCRYGGDEFVILLNEIEKQEDAAQVARKIHELVSVEGQYADLETGVSLSIGISIYPDDGDDTNSLLRKADAAMYQAKASGKKTSLFYRPDMDVIFNTRRSIQ